MAMNTGGIQKGMDVFDVTGDKVGSVDDVLTVAAYSETGATASSGYDTGAGSYDSGVAGQGSYLKVNQGGILGIGAKELYVPFSAVQNVTPGESLTINCLKNQVTDLYGNKPEFLGS